MGYATRQALIQRRRPRALASGETLGSPHLREDAACGRSSGRAWTGPSPIGRDAELAALSDLVRRLPSPGFRMRLIGGDAGAGKTTLAEAAASAAAAGPAPMITVRGQCAPSGGDGLPYASIIAVLRGLTQRYGNDQVMEWAGGGRAALGLLLPDLAAAGATPSQPVLFEAVARLLRAAASHQPPLILVEDLHWADESTRTLLRFLASTLVEEPILVLGTFRSDELGRRHPLRALLADLVRLDSVDRLDLRPLDRAATTALIKRTRGRRPSPAGAETVYLRSGGNPFYVEEIVAAADYGSIPATLREALGTRIARLSDEALDTVRLVAVIGRRADHDLLAALSQREGVALERDLRECVAEGVLVADGAGYAFRHALLREAVEEDLLAGERARLHRAVAAALEPAPDGPLGQDQAFALALHWLAARDVERAFTWSVRAARTPSAAQFETLRMYEHVLELGRCSRTLRLRVCRRHQRVCQSISRVRRGAKEAQAGCCGGHPMVASPPMSCHFCSDGARGLPVADRRAGRLVVR